MPLALREVLHLALILELGDTRMSFFRVKVPPPPLNIMGEAFLLTVGAFLLTVKLLCLQSLKALIRGTFPL